jgi:hypothetical protein
MELFSQNSSLTTRTESEIFEIYSIFSVLNGLLGENIEPLEVHLKGSEFGLDGVGVTIQGSLATNKVDADELLLEVKNPQVEFLFFQSKQVIILTTERFRNFSMRSLAFRIGHARGK